MNFSASTIQPTDPKELRPLLHDELDKLSDDYLAPARQLILEIQMQQVLEELDDAADQARAAGRLTPERIVQSIADCHRVKLQFPPSKAMLNPLR